MFCFKRSFSEKFTCVEVIDRRLAGNISPVFRCAPTQATNTASVIHCLCFTPVHCAPLLCFTDLCQCFTFLCRFCVRTIYRNRSGRSCVCSVPKKWLDRTLREASPRQNCISPPPPSSVYLWKLCEIYPKLWTILPLNSFFISILCQRAFTKSQKN